ncbi:hypothetical protein TIFTF001_004117 [Ficus carica]|uniref:Prolamin-like domain-containing protein n=1 Tax=Ficus carica TaxID=3494 RepID=A0AA87ZJR4_FICCA|nr:hypothetical protein TIFTF001_004117 [Ficus carica]
MNTIMVSRLWSKLNLTVTLLKREGPAPDCWSTVGNPKLACIYDVVRFFLNRHTGDIGSGCCQAIVNVGGKCFPAMDA